MARFELTAPDEGRARGGLASGGVGWLSLFVVFLLTGCKEKPLVCETQGIFRPVPAAPKAGGSLPDVRALERGLELELAQAEIYPTSLIFFAENRVRVAWRARGHIAARTQALYSPAEGVVRSVKYPDEVFSLRKFSDGSSERVWLTFDTPTCADPAAPAGRLHCVYGPEEWLVADMTCRRESLREGRRRP